MSGWMIMIEAQTPEKQYTDMASRKALMLAHWETSWNGLKWLNELLAEGKATELSLNAYYPNRYTARASDVLPILGQGVPDIPEHGYWKDAAVINHDKMAACPLDQILLIEVWDLT
jgi:hypothetical protein